MLPRGYTRQESLQEFSKRMLQTYAEKKVKQAKRLEHLLTLAEGIIPEDQKEKLELRIKSDVDMSPNPFGYHVEKAIMMIGYLNND